MADRKDDVIEREPQQAPPVRATDPQKPGERLRPGPQGATGTTGPAGGKDPAPASAHDPEAGGAGPDDSGRGDSGAL